MADFVKPGDPVTDVVAVPVTVSVTVGEAEDVNTPTEAVVRAVPDTVVLAEAGTLDVIVAVTVGVTDTEPVEEGEIDAEGETEGEADTVSVTVIVTVPQEDTEGVAQPELLSCTVRVTEAVPQPLLDTDTLLETEADGVVTNEPVKRGLTDPLPDSEGCGVAQGVTLKVSRAVREAEGEEVMLGLPVAVPSALIVKDSESVPEPV